MLFKLILHLKSQNTTSLNCVYKLFYTIVEVIIVQVLGVILFNVKYDYWFY